MQKNSAKPLPFRLSIKREYIKIKQRMQQYGFKSLYCSILCFFVLKMRYVAQNGSRIVHVGHHLFQCL